jgi:hypothetical protein
MHTAFCNILSNFECLRKGNNSEQSFFFFNSLTEINQALSTWSCTLHLLVNPNVAIPSLSCYYTQIIQFDFEPPCPTLGNTKNLKDPKIIFRNIISNLRPHSRVSILHLSLPGSNLVLECDNSLGGVMVWKRGGVLAVGKMMVRRDGKGALIGLLIMPNIAFFSSCVVQLIIRGIGSVQR